MKLVILDRDGVINRDSENFIKSPDEWEAIPGSLEAVARLTQAGIRVVIATNQSGIGRGLFDMAALNAIHDKMLGLLEARGGRIDAIFYCPHAADANCACRKPKTGMFLEIAARFGIELTRDIYAIGDSPRDLEAAAAAGVTPLLVLTGKGEKTRADGAYPLDTPIFDNLAAAVEHLLSAT